MYALGSPPLLNFAYATLYSIGVVEVTEVRSIFPFYQIVIIFPCHRILEALTCMFTYNFP